MQVVWELDNLEQLGGNKLDVSGRPAVIAGPYGPAIEFDGVRDALFIGTNPLAGWRLLPLNLISGPMRVGWLSSDSCIWGKLTGTACFSRRV